MVVAAVTEYGWGYDDESRTDEMIGPNAADE